MSEPFFRTRTPDSGDDVVTATFDATSATVGPWDPRHMHGGPPAALLARAVERLPGGPSGGLLARTTTEFLAPVPVGPVVVTARWLRRGPRVALAEAVLVPAGADRPVALARAWRIRVTDDPVDLPTTPSSPPPGEGTERALPPGWGGGYLDAVEWRWAEGDFGSPGPAAVWSRLRVALVDDEVPTGAQRVLAVADSGSGISAVADLRITVFVNTELTVHLVREPLGDEVWMRAATRLDPHGTGLTTSSLGDRGGELGTAAQALFVDRRQERRR